MKVAMKITTSSIIMITTRYLRAINRFGFCGSAIVVRTEECRSMPGCLRGCVAAPNRAQPGTAQRCTPDFATCSAQAAAAAEERASARARDAHNGDDREKDLRAVVPANQLGNRLHDGPVVLAVAGAVEHREEAAARRDEHRVEQEHARSLLHVGHANVQRFVLAIREVTHPADQASKDAQYA